MAYTAIDDPEKFFQAFAYTGGSGNTEFDFDGTSDMAPGLVWIKNRGQTDNHAWIDSVRGNRFWVGSNVDDQQDYNNAAYLFNFRSDGFTTSNTDVVGKNNETYISWNWKSSDSTVSDTTTNYLANSQRVSETSGFTTLTYTGNASNTVLNTGLSDKLDWSITKRLDADGDWIVWHRQNVGTVGRNYFVLNTTAAATQNHATIFQNIAPQMDGSISYQAIGSNSAINVNTATYVSYGWAPRQGFSRFGKYVGNGSANGPFVYTGFKPAFLFQKNVSAGNNGSVKDNKRNPFNPVSIYSLADANEAEGTSGLDHDFLSNGFKINTNSGGVNDDGETYIYAAFAESPFVNSNKVPNNAR